MNHTSRHQRVPFIRRAKAMATVAVVAATAVLASTTSPAFADPIRVGQGETVIVPSPCSESFSVDPSIAGTVSPSNNLEDDCRLLFTASPTYSGLVSLHSFDFQITYEYEVTSIGSASIGATFTPTAAPGPCLEIVSGATISFGNVTPGLSVSSGAGTYVRSCSQVDLTFAAAVSPATSGDTVWQPDRWNGLTNQDLSPNSFAYQLRTSLDGDSFSAFLDTVPSVFINYSDYSSDVPLQPGTTRVFSHSIRLGAGSSGLGQQFTTTVTLTATAA